MTSFTLDVIPVPAFRDNYLWLFHQTGDTRAYIVDPGDAEPVEKALAERGLSLAGILITHHHPDHIGGVDRLLARWQVPVYGPSGGSVPQVSRPVNEGETLTLENGASFRVIAVPGHTLDHLAYFCDQTRTPVLFCGDTLFAGGCGRLFEGKPAQMYESLGKLAELPDSTEVYCAHEYTMANLAFASAVENDNTELAERVKREQAKRDRHEPTVPSTIGLEKSTNPFMRCDLESVKKAAEVYSGKALSSAEEVLAAVRSWKDNF